MMLKSKLRGTFILLTFLLTLSCSTSNTSNVTVPEKRTSYIARITYYYPQQPYGSKVACPNAKVAREGITVAAHPDFKFGTKIYIPELKNTLDDGYFTVQDRGPAITRKSASGGKNYVFDVFVSSHSKLRKLTSTKPMYMRVYIVAP